jgi:sulfite reductase (NADPH) hemoprotein beta-component
MLYNSWELIQYKSYDFSNSVFDGELVDHWIKQRMPNLFGRIPDKDDEFPCTTTDVSKKHWNIAFVKGKPVAHPECVVLYAADIYTLQKQILLAFLLCSVQKVVIHYEDDSAKLIDLDQEGQVKEELLAKRFKSLDEITHYASKIGLYDSSWLSSSPAKSEVVHVPPVAQSHVAKLLQQTFKDVDIYENENSHVSFGLLLADLQKQELFVHHLSSLQSNLVRDWLDGKKVDPELLKKELKSNGIHETERLNRKPKWLIDDGSLSRLDSTLLHSIVSSNENINVLMLDNGEGKIQFDAVASSNTRDVGLYCLNYGNTYTASICPLVSFSQAVTSLQEAAAFSGPSVVILNEPKANKDQVTQIQLAKELIDSAKVTLYRWNPKLGMTVDSSKPKSSIEQFLKKESTLSLMIEPIVNPTSEVGGVIQDMDKLVLEKSKESYTKLFGSMKKTRLLVLFGSDGGNAESLAKRISMEAKEKGLWVKCLAMDAFVAEDLSKEENVLFVVSTAGQGEFPSNARETWKYLSSASKETLDLSSVQTGVFALGDRHYWPREEDKHYFCKAGKDLYGKLETLGAQLKGLGIGDDRDADGYYTGYFQYIPIVWEWLGVSADAIETVTISDDAIKAASRYLRGTIAQGLVDESTGALAEMDTKLTKFHGIYQQDDRDIREHRARKGMEKAFSFMIRVRVPGGVCTPAQYLAMDEISDKYANGTIKITTRQAFQFHGVIKQVLKKTMQEINKSLLDTIAACGDVNRNVMCNPNPGNSTIHAQVLQTSKDLSAHLTPSTGAYHEIWLDKKLVAGGEDEPLYGKTYLPRKFKIAIAVPPSNDVDVLAHDLGYIAIVENNRLIGYNVTVGGGMGQTHGNKKTYPVLAKQLGFVTIDQAVKVGEAVMLVQRDYGDRTNRKHARLKYTIEDRGLEWFREEVEKRIGWKLPASKPFKFTSNGDRYGWHKQTDGTWSYTMFIQNGRIKDTSSHKLKTGLKEIALNHKGDIALTPNQHLMLMGIPEYEKSRIGDLLRKYNIDNNHSAMRLNSMACVALPTCALAMAESERYLPTLVEKIEVILENLGLRDDAITIRMTGCPNGCARPSIAEVGFIGKAPGMYNMYLGGGHAGERLNRLYMESIGEDVILEEMKKTLTRYVKERHVEEKFGDFCIRVGIVQ